MSTPSSHETRRHIVVKKVTVSGNLRRACLEFNSDRFFECHETLEELWQQERGPVRDLYKGLIQVAAGFVHICRPNHFGADRLMRTALGYLAPYRESGAMGFDVETIASKVEVVRARVNELGPEHIGEYDLSLRPFYTFDEAKLPEEARRWGAWGFDKDGNPLELEIRVVD